MKTKKSNRELIRATYILSIALFLHFSFSGFEVKGNSISVNSPVFNPPSPNNRFIIGAMDGAYDQSINFSKLNEIGVNVWHRYADLNLGWTGFFLNQQVADSWNTDISVYQSAVSNRVNTNFDSHNMLTLFQRPKFERYCFGQSSEYQCERVDRNEYYWFYSYVFSRIRTDGYIDDIIDNSSWGAGVKVKKCSPIPSLNSNSEILIDSGLKANMEQVNTFWDPPYIGDQECIWHIMPRIRIDTAFANNNNNWNTNVCKIVIKNWKGEKREQILKVGNFINPDSNNYKGDYLTKYFNILGNNITNFLITDPTWFKDSSHYVYPNLTDFQVYWYNNCNMWIDYIKVEDDYAHKLLTLKDSVIIDRIVKELRLAASLYPKAMPYIEEFEFNHIPCIAAVNKLLKDSANADMTLRVCFNYTGLTVMLPYWWENYFSPEEMNHYLFERAQLEDAIPEPYPLYGMDGNETDIPENYPLYGVHGDGTAAGGWGEQYKSKSPNTLPIYQSNPSINYSKNDGLLTFKADPDEYESWLQNQLDTWQGSSGMLFMSKYCDTLAREYGKRFTFLHQSHMWWTPSYKLKEPTNEEVELMVNLPIHYGAKGVYYFAFMGFGAYTSNYFARGLINTVGDIRTENSYQQLKWNKYIEIGEKLTEWGPTIMSFNPENTKSYIYYNENERNALLNNNQNYISGISTFQPGTGSSACNEDNPIQNYVNDCPEETYVQFSTFANTELNTKYFMITNRRCSPAYEAGSQHFPNGLYGGKRLIRLSLKNNASAFNGFNNWKIENIIDPAEVYFFNKNQANNIILSNDFKPAEGRIYKITPVVQTGGELVTNEILEGSLTIKAPIKNNGYNITVEPNSTLNFIDSGEIEMTGGKFICGEVRTDHGTDVTFTSANRWNGLTINNCDLVQIGSTKFEKVDSTQGDQNFALKIIDCDTLKIRYCKFITENGMKNGAISINYLPSESPVYPLIDILGNTFDCNGISNPSVQVMNYGDIQNPVLIRWNNFEGNNSSTGLLLNNVTAGVVKNNVFSEYLISINALATYMDIYNNTIENLNSEYNLGLNIASGSNINLNTALNGFYIGGLNKFKNYQNGSVNIHTDNSTFDISYGGNVFELTDGIHHFEGIMSMDNYTDPFFAEQNCFKIYDSPYNPPSVDVSWQDNNYGTVSFQFEPFSCNEIQPQDYELISYGDIDDTLWTEFGGYGGGYSNKELKNILMSVLPLKIKSDSLKLQLRRKNLQEVIRIGNEILDNYIDSIVTIDAIQPLYYATMRTDDSNNTGIYSLKTKLENLILNNSENDALVLRCNYFIQKCKVNLGEYSSALSGFNTIMQNYPYNWEGIVASWDYASTNLISQGGSGEGETILSAQRAELSHKPNSDDPKRTKETIEKTLQNEKERTEKQIKVEEQLVKELGRDDKNEKNIKQSNSIKSIEKKLQQKKIMQEVIKPRKPETVIEHIKFVNSDIQKIYSFNNKRIGIEDNIFIPELYKLEQNYPNPFNPITKINFSLPKESKVTVVIYDILGRKVAQLVNNELRQAGRYEVQFNGQNYASGIYFYRLVANDFIDTKRMILIK